MSKIVPIFRKKTNSKKWILIITTPLEYEAHLICGLFEIKGIPYRLQCLRHTPHPVSSGQLGSYLIWVPQHWEQIAKKLISYAER